MMARDSSVIYRLWSIGDLLCARRTNGCSVLFSMIGSEGNRDGCEDGMEVVAVDEIELRCNP